MFVVVHSGTDTIMISDIDDKIIMATIIMKMPSYQNMEDGARGIRPANAPDHVEGV